MYGSLDQGLCLVVFIHQSILVVHYSLGFTAYKAASGGVFFRCGTPKDAVYKDYKAKALGPKIRTSEDPTCVISQI